MPYTTRLIAELEPQRACQWHYYHAENRQYPTKCGERATSLIISPEGNALAWRCDDHEGYTGTGTIGQHELVPVHLITRTHAVWSIALDESFED